MNAGKPIIVIDGKPYTEDQLAKFTVVPGAFGFMPACTAKINGENPASFMVNVNPKQNSGQFLGIGAQGGFTFLLPGPVVAETTYRVWTGSMTPDVCLNRSVLGLATWPTDCSSRVFHGKVDKDLRAGQTYKLICTSGGPQILEQ